MWPLPLLSVAVLAPAVFLGVRLANRCLNKEACARSRQAAGTHAISIVLQHAALGEDARLVRSISQVCRDWRTAVQRSACALNISISGPTPERLSSLGRWLRNHPGRVKRLSINVVDPISSDVYLEGPCNPELGTEEAEALLLSSMGIDTPPPTAGCSPTSVTSAHAAPPAAVAAATAAAFPVLAQLRSFTSDMRCSQAILQILPAATLRVLRIHPCSNTLRSTGFGYKLMAMRNLQNLSLRYSNNTKRDPVPLADGYVNVVASLTKLKHLNLGSLDFWPLRTHKFPTSLRSLTLGADLVYGEVSLDLAYLTQLETFTLNPAWLTHDSKLHEQVKVVEVNCRGVATPIKSLTSSTLHLTQLQQLTQLSLQGITDEDSLVDVKVLGTQLPNLQELSLSYVHSDEMHGASHCSATAEAWKDIRALKNLEMVGLVFVASLDPIQNEWSWVLHNLKQATQLKRLAFQHCTYRYDDATRQLGSVINLGFGADLCKVIGTLTELRELVLCPGSWDENFYVDQASNFSNVIETGYLGNLSNLTKLSFGFGANAGYPSGLDIDIARELITSLTQLQWLCMIYCGFAIASANLLPAIAQQLKDLRHLQLGQYEAGKIIQQEKDIITVRPLLLQELQLRECEATDNATLWERVSCLLELEHLTHVDFLCLGPVGMDAELCERFWSAHRARHHT